MDHIDIIKKMPYIHCARGPQGCDKCRQMAKKEPTFCLVRVYLKSGKIARPMTEIFVGCRRIYGEYDILKRFENSKEAKKYAIKTGTDITFD
ncbi:MAG: hypothetical protein GF383_11665 [Candidatus Lokiarchaeota archaeon]|nr:hypothetical protein [Candidatus Lokiarchaeota archaeon]MBD3341409.1 hypothetical protein [Candidatus Lokiarchaeota archaeon]